MIDTPDGIALAAESSAFSSTLTQLTHDLSALARRVFSRSGRSQTAWLHSNHLGAIEAATDKDGAVIWRARYAPFGAATINANNSVDNSKSYDITNASFTLNLRLPGQYEDAETGLYYNGQRYYDPARGEYLTPDPLGTPDGPNGYSNVRYNPLKYIDPDGLILFAFDGTGNSDNPSELRRLGNGRSNVVRFRDAYNDGAARYISGVGTLHEDARWGNIENILFDEGTNRTGTRRIDRMLTYFMEEANLAKDNEVMNVDIVGFSRGAAQARDFANIINDMTDAKGQFSYNRSVQDASGQSVSFKGKQCVKFRFLGLWDTVISTNSGRDYRLAIPASFANVSQAVALNEYRNDATSWDLTRINLPGNKHWGGFPLESIGASSATPGAVRVERGFIGAHADIGGGYAEGENQLSFVALNWMAAQAQQAGVKMRTPVAVPTFNPVIHDQSNAILVGNPVVTPQTTVRVGRATQIVRIEDREVRGAVNGNSARTMRFNNNSMINAETHRFINYTARRLGSNPADLAAVTGNRTGTVDINGYMNWLRQNGYCFAGDACARPGG